MFWRIYSNIQLNSVAQSCPTVCYPMDCSMPGFPVPHHLLELAQTHIHWVSEVIQPSCPLSFSSCLLSFPASECFLMSQLFISVGQSIRVSASASILLMDMHGWFPSVLTGLVSLQSNRLSRVFFNTTVQKHQFFGAQPSLWSNSHIQDDYWKNHSFD